MNESLHNSGTPYAHAGIHSARERIEARQEFAVSMLLVSADEQILSTLSRALEKFKTRCAPAGNLQKAEMCLRESKFDGAILDFRDPSLATAVLKMMRDSKKNCSSMIIAIVDDPAAAHEAFARGASLTIPPLQAVDPLTRCLRSSYYLVLRNKRASIRFPLDKEISILRGHELVHEGRITNLSESGLRMMCKPALEHGSQWDMTFQLPTGAQVRAKVRIVWSHATGDAGGQFVKLEDESMKAIQEWINTRLEGRLS